MAKSGFPATLAPCGSWESIAAANTPATEWWSRTAGALCTTFAAARSGFCPREPLELRLKKISEGLTEIILAYSPEEVAIEDVFYAVNVKSALKLGHVRGVAMLVAAQAGLRVIAYSPLSIKSAVVGYGKAEKSQVQIMVARLLELPAPPESPDAADALAIAICHLHTAATLRRQQAGAAGHPPYRIKFLPRMTIRFAVVALALSLSSLAQQAATPAPVTEASVWFNFEWSEGFHGRIIPSECSQMARLISTERQTLRRLEIPIRCSRTSLCRRQTGRRFLTRPAS